MAGSDYSMKPHSQIGVRDRRRAFTMTTTMSTAQPRGRRFWRSAAAVSAGFLFVVVLSLATDQLLHTLEVYPPWGEPMWEPGLNLLALSYRTVYNVASGYLTASLAPQAPMRHVVVLGIIGLVAGTAGAIAAMDLDLGPSWYPITLAITAFPTVWLGGWFYVNRH
jgi:hypothetical protein